MVYYKIEMRFDFPPELIIEYLTNLERVWLYEGQTYESLTNIKKYSL